MIATGVMDASSYWRAKWIRMGLNNLSANLYAVGERLWLIERLRTMRPPFWMHVHLRRLAFNIQMAAVLTLAHDEGFTAGYKQHQQDVRDAYEDI